MKKFDLRLYIEDRRKHGLTEEDIVKSIHVWGLKCDGKTVKPNKHGIYNINGTGFVAVPEWCREVACRIRMNQASKHKLVCPSCKQVIKF